MSYLLGPGLLPAGRRGGPPPWPLLPLCLSQGLVLRLRPLLVLLPLLGLRPGL